MVWRRASVWAVRGSWNIHVAVSMLPAWFTCNPTGAQGKNYHQVLVQRAAPTTTNKLSHIVFGAFTWLCVSTLLSNTIPMPKLHYLWLAHQEGVVDTLHIGDQGPVLQRVVLVLVVHNQAGERLLNSCWGCNQGLNLVLDSCARQQHTNNSV